MKIGKRKRSLNSTDLGTYDGGPSEALIWIVVETLLSTREASRREVKVVYAFKTFTGEKRNQFRGMHDPWRMFGLCFSMCRKGAVCINEAKNPEIKDKGE